MKTDSNPLLTIIVAVFNGANTLQQCIDSVTQQTYANKELIIIDGGSRDSTVELLKANNQQISYWVSEPDSGIYNAWNKGLAKAKGDWICFLGADDYFWNANVLENVAHTLILLPGHVRYAYGEIMLINSDDAEVHRVGLPWEIAGPKFSKTMSVTHPGSMHKKALFSEHGYFDESFKIAGDYEFLLRELKSNSAAFVPLTIAAMRLGGISSNIKHSLLQLKEVRRAQRKHGFNIPSVVWILAVVRVYIRMWIWRILGERNARQMLDLGRKMMGQDSYWTKN